MQRILVTAFLLIIIVLSSFSQTTRRVPQDYSSIQAAINASVNGDIVLVSDGRYGENIVIRKKITVASLYYQGGDTSHISQTIIDGSWGAVSDSASAVTFGPGTDSTSRIIGFTITGGRGNKHLDYSVTPVCPYKSGGGVDVYGGGASILHNVIQNNAIQSSTDSASGGGISVCTWKLSEANSYAIIEDNVIGSNSSGSSGWAGAGGIAFWGTSGRIARNRILNNTTKYCSGIAAGAIALWGIDTVVIEENVIQGNKATVNIAGVELEGDGCVGYIRNNLVIDNVATSLVGGISIGYSGYAVIERNYVARNRGTTIGGIYLFYTGMNSIVRNNIVVGNTGDGIRLSLSSSALIVNNTIVGNTRYGLNVVSPSIMRALNNVVWTSGFGSILGSPYASYNLIQGGYSGTGNINTDPRFDAGDTLYHLSKSSPCIGAGAASATIGSSIVSAPTNDYFGTIRPRPDFTNPDMGAVEHDLGEPGVDVEESAEGLPLEFCLGQNYPNPFNPTTVISYQLPVNGPVSLKVYNLLGKEVAILVNETKEAGTYDVQFSSTGMASGVYFYKLVAGKYSSIKKLVLLR